MRIVAHAPGPAFTVAVGIACDEARPRIAVDYAASPQEFGALLYRIPEAVGMLVAPEHWQGAAWVRELRHGDVRNPILVILEKLPIHPEWRAQALAGVLFAGADDAQGWPLDMLEMMARLQALARRERGVDDLVVRFAVDCRFDPVSGMVTSPSGAVQLSRSEADVFALLTARPESIITKEAILDRLYGGVGAAQPKIVDVFLCKLRKKLQLVTGELDVIETVWGRGYTFRPEGFRPAVHLVRQMRIPA